VSPMGRHIAFAVFTPSKVRSEVSTLPSGSRI
jgi:hypothetical protein